MFKSIALLGCREVSFLVLIFNPKILLFLILYFQIYSFLNPYIPFMTEYNSSLPKESV